MHLQCSVNLLNRVCAIKDGATTLAAYTSLGSGTVVRIDYTQPTVMLDLWGGTSGSVAPIDRFGRVSHKPLLFHAQGDRRACAYWLKYCAKRTLYL